MGQCQSCCLSVGTPLILLARRNPESCSPRLDLSTNKLTSLHVCCSVAVADEMQNMMMPRDPQTGVVDVAMQNLAFNLLDSLFTIKCHNLLVAATGSRMATFMDLVRGLCRHGQQAATAWNMQHQHGMLVPQACASLLRNCKAGSAMHEVLWQLAHTCCPARS